MDAYFSCRYMVHGTIGTYDTNVDIREYNKRGIYLASDSCIR